MTNKIEKVFQAPASSPFRIIELTCKELLSEFDPVKMHQEGESLTKASEKLNKQIKVFQEDIEKITVLSLVMLWARLMANDSLFGEKYICMMDDLIRAGLLPIIRDKKSISLEDFQTIGNQNIIESIRCHSEWTIQKREDLVQFFIKFSQWLAKVTYGYLTAADDLDRKMSIKRKLPFETYIKLISELSLRERILTKMFYLGGERELEDVLSIKIQDIDFKDNTIKLSNYSIQYPRHVLSDLSSYIIDRGKGYVFLGRTGEKMSRIVPYRCLKLAANKIGLPASFTFKDLVKEI